MPTKSDARTARALLAVFNHDMAGRLVRRILAEKSGAAWQRLADAVLELLPKAANEKVWPLVAAYAEREAATYIASPAFRAKVEAMIKQHADAWASEAVERAVQERALAEVRKIAAGMPGHDQRTLQGRLQALVGIELERVAREKAAQAGQ
jgi:hypothetical protein